MHRQQTHVKKWRIKQMKKVCLLDTGVNAAQLTGSKKIKTYCVENGNVLQDDNCKDLLGHGTAIANTLLKNNGIELNVFKIFDNDYTCKIEQLIAGLSYINQMEDVYLVHLSLGVRRYDAELERICKLLYEKGVILVAACDNGMVMSYPAAFDFVISVAPSYRCVSTNQFVFIENSPINLKAKAGGQQILNMDNEIKLIQTGSSFAAAHVSAQILSWEERLSRGDILKRFREISVFQYEFEKTPASKKCFPICNAVVFPYNKENHALIKFDQLLDFKIKHVYDIKFSSQIGKTVSSFWGNEYVIENIKNCDWDSFDTFILGHVDELSVIYKKDLKKEIVNLCMQHHKNLYLYDDYNLEKHKFGIDSPKINAFCPAHISNAVSNKFGWYYQHATPILAVLGTSKKQGKFTLQLQLRKVLLEKNVNLGQLGTEPSSLLFGMDEMFTLGYFSNVQGSIDTVTENLNEKIHNIDILGKDLIVTGSQSAFLPYNSYNSNTVNFFQFAFLYATMPDGIILAVNQYDDFDYIDRTIKSVRALTNSQVFLFALYPFEITFDRVIDSQKRKLTKQELEKCVSRLETTFHIPAIVIGETEYEEKLFSEICKFFS